jgi:hypothetical protein
MTSTNTVTATVVIHNVRKVGVNTFIIGSLAEIVAQASVQFPKSKLPRRGVA